MRAILAANDASMQPRLAGSGYARAMRRPSPLLFGLLLVLGSEVATAAPPPKPKAPATRAESAADVETAEQLYAKLDYDRANEIADRLVKQRGLTHDQLVRAYRILAVTDAILDRDEAARDAFLQLLVFDPDYAVDPALGPKVGAPFVEARGQYRSLPTKPGVDVVASVRDVGGQLRVAARDPSHIAKKISVGWRWTSSGDYVVSTLAVGDGTVEVGPATQGRTRLDFYAQALDDRDNAVFESGNPVVPKSAFAETGPKVVVPPARPVEKSGGLFSSPIFWAIAGAAVLGGGTAIFFATRPQDPPTQALLSPSIRCGSDLCK